MRLYTIFGGAVFCSVIRKRLVLPKETQLLPGFWSQAGNIRCGRKVSLGDTFFIDYAPVLIGDGVGFSFGNKVITSTHDLQDFNRIIARPVVFQENVWITSCVTILGGVTIGKNSVIGAGSIVTRSIPPDVFAAGSPCRVIRPIKRG